MSTEFQPGQKVRHRVSERVYTIEKTRPETDDRLWFEEQEGWFDQIYYEVITPAPLDPAAVKAGDTVTVSSTTTGGAAYEIVGKVWEPSHSPGHLWVGPIALDALGVTLTDHQPALEPEWEPGDMAAVTARGWVNGWSVRTATNDGWASHDNTDDVRRDDEVESVRPLVVIDPVAARKSLEDNGWGEHETNDILHELGIEAAR